MVDAFMWIVAHQVLAHIGVALVRMGLVCPVLQWLNVDGFAWHAAAYVSLFFYAREAAQAERALKPALGDPNAVIWTPCPGHWSAGGARVSEWLAPTLVVLAIAAVTPKEPFLRRWQVIRLPGPIAPRD